MSNASRPSRPSTALSVSTAPESSAVSARLSRAMVMLFAVAAGLSVANIYYAQPLLTAIASTFGIGSGVASLVVIVGTVSYATGLALLVPLGDMVDRRRLVVILLLVVAVAEVVAAAAPSIGVLVAASAAFSLCAVVAPILVSLAATLAAAEQRGQVTGTVLSGVLLGVLLARSGGGLVAEWGGWRAVYAIAAALMLLLAVTLYRTLPTLAPPAILDYPELLRSVVQIVRDDPVLQLRCAYGFVSFAGFTVLWTSIAFLLSAPPFSYGEAVIGLFGLVGVVGAYAARLAGGLVDRGKDHAVTGVLLAAILLSWGMLGAHGGGWLVAMLLGVVVLDFGVQGMQATNLSVIYRRRPEARSRITMAYMTVYFLGGFAGAAASGAAYAAAGWEAVCLVGASFAVIALLLWLAESSVQRRLESRAAVREGTKS